ncbi:MAG: nucleoside monophosphate kinase [Patescibacteria group bacterium]
MKKIIIMIGPPGSGKGTQAKKVAFKYNYSHISTGDLLRALARDTDLNSLEKEAVAQMKSGNLVSDQLIYRLVFGEIEKNLAEGRGVVLDGAIRNLEQARGFQNFFKAKNLTGEVLALEITLSDKDSWERLIKRRGLENRQDDDPKIIKDRIAKQGNKVLAPIINFYKDLGVLVKIDGNQTIEDVEKDIESILC